MKIYLTILIGMLLIGTVTAGVISMNTVFGIEKVSDFSVTDKSSPSIQVLKLTVDGKVIEVNKTKKSEKEWDAQDIQSIVNSINGTVTEIELVGTGVWNKNKYGYKSFSDLKLKENVCSVEGGSYDTKLKDCVMEEVVEESEIISMEEEV